MSTITLLPAQGGDLMTRVSADVAGPANYVTKRDWRTELDQEVRREGDVPFKPDIAGPDSQSTPDGDKRTLNFTARRDDGKTLLIVGSQTKLWAFWEYEDNAICEAGICEPGILAPICDGTWLLIGSGFTVDNSHVWEAKNVGGLAIFNNGIDLPVSYRIGDFKVQPVHELREQGLAYVDTIEEVAGILMCGGLGEIFEDYLATVISVIGYSGFANGQEEHIDRVHYDILWGDPVSPLRWGSAVPGAMTAGSRKLTLEYPVQSMQPGDELRVIGAGENGGDLITTFLFRSSSTVWILADRAAADVTKAKVGKSDAASLIVGHYPLLDDSTAVLRIKKLGTRFIVAKDDGFVVGEYTGTQGLPFTFQRVYTGEEGLFWRWALVEFVGESLLYAGKTEFYTFDLITLRPQIHPKLQLCSNVFFDAVKTASQDDVFAFENAFTKEIWFCFPSAGADKGLALSFRDLEGAALNANQQKCSTIGAAYTCGGMVDVPTADIVRGSAERWLLLGRSDGALRKYAFDRINGPIAWRRNGADYSSALWPGIADFGDAFNEKHVSQYLLLLSSQSPNSQITVSFFGVRNPSEDPTELPGSPKVFATPSTRNTAYLHYVLHLIQERIVATGASNVRIGKRVWQASGMGGASIQRK